GFEGLTLLYFSLQGETFAIPVNCEIKQTHTFRFKPPKLYKKITVFGSFNSWNRDNLPLSDNDGDGIYELTIPFEPGRYEYRFFADGEEFIDPLNPEKIPNPFGEYNSLLTITPRHGDKSFLHFLEKQVTADSIKFSYYYQRENQPVPLQPQHVIALAGNRRLAARHIRIFANRIRLGFSTNDQNLKIILRLAVTQGGQSTLFQTITSDEIMAEHRSKKGFDWQDAILYSIMIDRFLDGDSSNTRPVQHPELSPKANYHGGDLAGILQKLQEGYFDSLGVNVLWLSPVNQNTRKAYREWPPPHRYFSAYHGYWPIHHQKVDDRFGDMVLLKELVDEAHSRGMKVLLDFIANHVHEDHPFYREHRDWFGKLELPDGRKNIRFWDEYRLTTWFEPFLPSFDYLGSLEALEVMSDNGVWWLKQSGADGFRQDAVKHVPNKFWRRLTRKIKREIAINEKRRIFQIGETFGSYKLISSYVNNGQLDAQFNFNLYYTARSVFLTPGASFKILAGELQKTLSVYGMNNLMGNLMDSHDQVRYMAFADGDLGLDSPDAGEIGWTNPPRVDKPASYEKAKLYLTYLLTIPGVPTIYYGDEIGMTGAADPDNRRQMRFGNQLKPDEKSMLTDVRKIVWLRRKHPALRRGDFQTLYADTNCFAYLRSDTNERILVVLNKSDQPQQIEIALPEFYRVSGAVGLLNGEKIQIENNRLMLDISHTSFMVFKILSHASATN
ncbi:MAG: alpha-amylase family glycosyl hydrolase, partial [Calditrichia bacterium]